MIKVLGDYDRINVMIVDARYNGICSTRGCKKKAKYWLFVDDGKPKMSRHYNMSCVKHLPLNIEKANTYNRREKKK